MNEKTQVVFYKTKDLYFSLFLWVILAVFSFGDFLTTAFIVEREGHIAELNPLLRYLIGIHGMQAVAWFKGVTLGFLLSLILLAGDNQSLARKLMYLTIIVQIAVYFHGWMIFLGR